MQHVYHETSSITDTFDIVDEMLEEIIDDRYGRSRSRIKDTFKLYLEEYDALDKSMELIASEKSAVSIWLATGAVLIPWFSVLASPSCTLFKNSWMPEE